MIFLKSEFYFDTQMNIVYALDDGYKLYTAVSIYSLLSNKNKESVYKIHILHHPDLDIHYFDKLQEYFNIQFNFVNMGDTSKDLYISRHIKIPAYYRLFICDVLPDLDRCIYLDGDTIILKDLSELYNTDLGDNIIGGVYDLCGGIGKHRENHPLNEPKKYINSGVLLINLNRYKNESTILIEYAKNHECYYHDQDVINYVLENKITLLPLKYNFYNNLNYIRINDTIDEYYRNLDEFNIFVKTNQLLFGDITILHFIIKPFNSKSDSYFIVSLFGNIYHNYLNLFLKTMYNNNNEYVICCCAKNEQHYISEWVDYHLKLGFDHIYIYNNDDDQSILQKIFDNNNKVSLIDYSSKKEIQKKYIADFYVCGSFEWCAFIDCDEFITLNGYDNIKDYINEFPDDCQQICLNWLCYGHNNNYDYNTVPIQNRMPFCAIPITWTDLIDNKPINTHIKSIVKKSFNIERFNPNPHSLMMRNSYNNKFEKITNGIDCKSDQINYDIAYIKHYYVRDIKYFINTKIKQDSYHNSYMITLNERWHRFKFCNNESLPNEFLKVAHIPNVFHEKLKNIKILCKNQEKLLPLLKKDLNILYCGDLKNNNIFINIANYNKCYYNWVLPELFNNVYKESDFDIIIE